MNSMIAFCGLDCTKCDAYIATKKNDDKLRKETAKKWEKEFNHPGLKPIDINCNGCLSRSEIIFKHCKVCEIRKCADDKEVKNCAYCDDYPCDKVKRFHEHVPEAKINLENIRKELD